MSKSTEASCGCGCVCHKVNGVFLILIGAAFLLGKFEIITQNVVNTTWPICLILMGLKSSVGRGVCRCCAHS